MFGRLCMHIPQNQTAIIEFLTTNLIWTYINYQWEFHLVWVWVCEREGGVRDS